MHVYDITDPLDTRVNDFRNLSDADRRPDLPLGKGLVIAEGVFVVQRMITSRFPIRALLGTPKRLDQLSEDHKNISAPCYRVSPEIMADIVGFHLNRGILAVASRVHELEVEELVCSSRTVVVLEGVNDHENLGSIFRNAAGLGVDAVILGAGCADPLYRRSVRVSMGHVLRIPYARATYWPRELELLRKHNFHLLAMTPQRNASNLLDTMAALKEKPIAILVGAEGFGLTDEALSASDTLVRIPMTRNTDSLNVATAAAIAFYERLRS